MSQITAAHTPVQIYDLHVTGNGVVKIAGTFIFPTVDITRYNITRPSATDTAGLQALVTSSLSSLLSKLDSIVLSNISETSQQLSFTATVASDTVFPTSRTERDYTLQYVIRLR